MTVFLGKGMFGRGDEMKGGVFHRFCQGGGRAGFNKGVVFSGDKESSCLDLFGGFIEVQVKGGRKETKKDFGIILSFAHQT